MLFWVIFKSVCSCRRAPAVAIFGFFVLLPFHATVVFIYGDSYISGACAAVVGIAVGTARVCDGGPDRRSPRGKPAPHSPFFFLRGSVCVLYRLCIGFVAL